jgi:predicted transcriptional regulator
MSERILVRVRDVMTHKFATVDGLMTVGEGLAKIKEGNAEALLVNKRHEDDEYGIVLLSDMARQVLAKDRHPDRVNIYEIMSKPVIAVDPDMDIRYCARLFDKFGLSCAPAIRDGKLVGIVSYADMCLRGLCAHIEGMAD